MGDGALWNGTYLRAQNEGTDGLLESRDEFSTVRVEGLEVTAVVVASQPCCRRSLEIV